MTEYEPTGRIVNGQYREVRRADGTVWGTDPASDLFDVERERMAEELPPTCPHGRTEPHGSAGMTPAAQDDHCSGPGAWYHETDAERAARVYTSPITADMAPDAG